VKDPWVSRKSRPIPIGEEAAIQLAGELKARGDSSNFSVNVVLPASGCDLIANVRRRAISSVGVFINLR
jgi:hypothetical protein